MTKITLPEKKYVASFDIHAQNTFTPKCPNELPVPEGDKIVTELNAQAHFASRRIGSKEAHNVKALWVSKPDAPKRAVLTPVIEGGENVDVHWPPHSIVGTKGFELIDGLPHITDYDYFVWQGIELDMHPYGVCYHDITEKLSTGAIEFLKQQAITHIIVGGLATDYCVKTSVLQLCRAGFNVIVNLGACRGLAEETIQEAMMFMQNAGAVFIESSNQLEPAML